MLDWLWKNVCCQRTFDQIENEKEFKKDNKQLFENQPISIRSRNR